MSLSQFDSPEPLETALCHNCFSAVDWDEHFCHHCATPLTPHAATDPLGRIYAQGDLWRKALEKKPMRPIVFIGMWLIFGPSAMTLGLAVPSILIADLANAPRFGSIADSAMIAVFLLIGLGLTSLHWVLLVRVTWNFLRSQEAVEAEEEPEEEG